MSYIFKAVPQFWASFNALTEEQQAAAQEVYLIFKENPFDPRLRTHPIARLTARYRERVYSVYILPDLRALFILRGSEVISIDIGSHALYR